MTLRELEPFNIPPVDNHQAAMFTKQLTGSESFEFDGNVKPKSYLINSLKYNYPRASFAYGLLLSVNIDTFIDMCNSGRHQTMEPILKTTVIGSILIEYGGNITSTRITANNLSL
jgi:hypothetical protein